MSVKFWAGSNESHDIVLRAELAVAADMKAGRFSSGSDPDLPPLWEMRGAVAVVHINGALVDGSAGYMRYYGVIGYDDIAEAAIAAASNTDAKSVLFHINTPGGAVDGIVDMTNVLTQVSTLKPSMVYTSSSLDSGGYWMAAGVKGEIMAGPTAEVGSIGVRTIITDAREAMKQMGITKTIVRAGKYKAEINPYEAPSEEAMKRLESQLDDVHTLFRAQVAKARTNLSAAELAEVTEGQTFLGQRAKSAGLVDRIGSFDQALKLLDSQNSPRDTSTNSKGKAMKITDLTPEQRAAIAAGASPASFGVTEAVPDPAAAEAARVASEAAAAEAARVAAAAASATPAVATGDLASIYQAQLTAANAELTTTKAKLMNLEVQVQAHKDTHEGLLAIARKAAGKLNVALGGSEASTAGMDAAAVIAEHARIEPLFLAKFKPGGAAVSVASTEQAPELKVDASKALPAGFAFAVKNAPSQKSTT